VAIGDLQLAADYRAACRARSHREFISKLAIAVEEADESVGWFRTIILAPSRRTAEANRGDKR
jgi:hypothetical protein